MTPVQVGLSNRPMPCKNKIDASQHNEQIPLELQFVEEIRNLAGNDINQKTEEELANIKVKVTENLSQIPDSKKVEYLECIFSIVDVQNPWRIQESKNSDDLIEFIKGKIDEHYHGYFSPKIDFKHDLTMQIKKVATATYGDEATRNQAYKDIYQHYSDILNDEKHYTQATDTKVSFGGQTYDRDNDVVRDGNCGVHALNRAFNDNKPSQSITRDLRLTREKLVKLTEAYFTLSVITKIPANSDLLKDDEISGLVQNAFAKVFDNNIDLFKAFISNDLNSKINNPDTNDEIRGRLQVQLDSLNATNQFNEVSEPFRFSTVIGFESNEVLDFYTNHQYQEPETVLDSFDNIKSRIKHDTDLYTKFAQEDKQWITNNEIEVYMRSKGYILISDNENQNNEGEKIGDNCVAATVLTFQSLIDSSKKLYIANSKKPNKLSGDETCGDHWFHVVPAAKGSDNPRATDNISEEDDDDEISSIEGRAGKVSSIDDTSDFSYSDSEIESEGSSSDVSPPKSSGAAGFFKRLFKIGE